MPESPMPVHSLAPSDAPPVMPAPGIAFRRGRAHEICGPSAAFLALRIGGAMAGPVLWLHPRWGDPPPYGPGILPHMDPGRLILAACRDAPTMLAVAEDALRTGLVPLVVAEIGQPPALTPVRRLHLAAGAAGTAEPPVMLLLSAGRGGAQGVESRWHIAPLPGWALDGRARWRLSRLRARMAAERAWTLRLDGARLIAGPDQKLPNSVPSVTRTTSDRIGISTATTAMSP